MLSPEEIHRLVTATTCHMHRTALSVAYGAGVRVAKVASLKVGDIDSERIPLRVERGKRNQYRNAMISEETLALMRQRWRVGRQQGVMRPNGICRRTISDGRTDTGFSDALPSNVVR